MSCTDFFHSWSDVTFDHWSTHRYNRVLHRACLTEGLQACLRVFAPSRRGQGHEQKLVLPRSLTLPQWPLPQLWSSWILAEYPVQLSSNRFCSACAPMLWNLPRILAHLFFFEEGGPSASVCPNCHLSPIYI